MSDMWNDRLSEYLDDELTPAEREAIELHLLECTACRTTLTELRGVVARAAALPVAEPSSDLWPEIARTIGAGVPALAPDVIDLASRRPKARRRIAFSVPQLVAASIVVALLSGGSVFLMRRGEATIEPVAQTPEGSVSIVQVAAIGGAAELSYANAVSDLEKVLAEGKAKLSPETVRVLEENLLTIDNAIAEAKDALAKDPGSQYLNGYLADSMKRKLQLLRQAADIVRADT